MARIDSSRLLTLGILLWMALLARPLAQDAEAPPDVPARITDPTIGVDELTLRLVPLSKEELGAAADAWFEIVKAKTQEVVDAQVAVYGTEGPAEEAARARVVALTNERDPLFDNFTTVLTSWQKKGGDEARIADLRAYSTSVLVEETRMMDFQTMVEYGREWALSTEGGIGLLLRLLAVVVALLVLVTVARLARGLTRRAAGRSSRLSKLLQAALAMVVYWIVIAIGLMVVLTAMGIDISPLYALIGGASFILAFALQSTLGNLAAGFMMMLNRPFDEGDFLVLGDAMGTVKSMNIVSTTLATPDNVMKIIPNSTVWGGVITNVTALDTRRVDLTFSISYTDDIEKAQGVIEEVVKRHPRVLEDPAPVIRVAELASSSVNFVTRPWVKKEDYWTVFFDLTQQVKQAFDAQGISIPFPQQDIHVRDAGQLLAKT